MSHAVKTLFSQSWQLWGFFAGILFMVYLLIIYSSPMVNSTEARINSLQIENRHLKYALQELQQQVKNADVQMIDLETLNQIQQQVIEELREGNAVLQENLYEMKKDVQRYSDSLSPIPIGERGHER